MKKLLYLATIGLFAIACSSGNTAENEEAKDDRVPVEISALELGTFRHYIQVQGQVESDRTIPVVPKASAEVMEVLVKQGQTVKKGQVIARMDDSILKAQEKELMTRLELAETLYERQKNLRDKEIGSEIQFLEAKNNWQALQAQLSRVREQLANYTVKAPISGYLEQIDIKEGEFINAGRRVAMLSNREALSVKAAVSEAYYTTVNAGDSAIVTFPALDKTIHATLHNVGQSLDPSNRTFETVVLLGNSESFPAPNMMSKVRINDQVIDSALTISMNIVLRDRQQPYVYLAKQEEGKWVARPQMVELGPAYADRVVVESGLKPGDHLITNGYQSVREGDILRIVE